MNQELRLKRVLGIPLEQKVELELEGLEESVFGDFNPRHLSFDMVNGLSVENKMNMLRDDLAEYGVLASWADYVPKLSIAMLPTQSTPVPTIAIILVFMFQCR